MKLDLMAIAKEVVVVSYAELGDGDEELSRQITSIMFPAFCAKVRRLYELGAGHAPEESSPAPVTQGKPADGGRFRLQVDRQTKASYATWEAAEKAGLAIKARRRGDRVEMLVLVRCMSPLMGTFLPCLPRRFDPTVWTGRALQAESDAPVRVEAHAKPAELVRSIARTLVHIDLAGRPGWP